MVKTNQFSSKGAYVQPYCKAVTLHGNCNVCLVGSSVPGQKNSWGLRDLDESDGGGVINDTDWGY